MRVCTLCMTIVLVGLAPHAPAQDPAPGAAASGCASSAAPTASSCDPAKAPDGGKKLPFSFEAPVLKSAQCSATIALEYSQRGSAVRVASAIENKDCAASRGEYTLLISVRDESLELKTLEFDAAWHRDDDRPVKLSADYPIGENVDLVSVRSRRLRCTCGEEAASAGQSEN
jgi:hypothetical protein